MNDLEMIDAPGRPGVTSALLFKDEREEVRVEEWAPGVEGEIGSAGGAEMLILTGSAEENSDPLRKHSWVRAPDGAPLRIKSGSEGVRFWVKTGHLRFVAAPTT